MEAAALVRTARFLTEHEGGQVTRTSPGNDAKRRRTSSHGGSDHHVRTKTTTGLWTQEVSAWFKKWGLPLKYPDKDEQEGCTCIAYGT